MIHQVLLAVVCITCLGTAPVVAESPEAATSAHGTDGSDPLQGSLRHSVKHFGDLYFDTILGRGTPVVSAYTSVEDLEKFLYSFPCIEILVEYLAQPDYRRVFAADDRAFRAVCRLMGVTLNRAVRHSEDTLRLSPDEEARRDELAEVLRFTRERSPEFASYIQRMRHDSLLRLEIDRLRGYLAVLIANRLRSDSGPGIEVPMDEIFPEEVDGLRELVLWLIDDTRPHPNAGKP